MCTVCTVRVVVLLLVHLHIVVCTYFTFVRHPQYGSDVHSWGVLNYITLGWSEWQSVVQIRDFLVLDVTVMLGMTYAAHENKSLSCTPPPSPFSTAHTQLLFSHSSLFIPHSLPLSLPSLSYLIVPLHTLLFSRIPWTEKKKFTTSHRNSKLID